MRYTTTVNQNVSRYFLSGNNLSGYLYNSKVLSRNRKEQAEAGRSPALLALRFGGFAYPPGILWTALNWKTKENRILGSIPYNNIKA
jgi:hypothetical protein